MAPEMNTEKQEAEGSTSAPSLQLSGEPCFAEGHRRTSKPNSGLQLVLLAQPECSPFARCPFL